MTPEEYKALLEKKVLKPESKAMTTQEHLWAMAAFFDLDTKKVRFYVRQLELNGKIK